ncbi:Gfo/Idh/MocA family protein [Marinibacterium profundimaris]|uniref:Oxidoreductase n=1 Tax=Marinibacterium profundimaris TaxID=1679460 RepID=A0A225NGW4_9RHOB|nr:Gfo/Idh/MocA family oxidoreductase [Marinibacterium profundimaris]OWU69872.1 oxidoreductase [Marinibacterium profundimaris]
MTTPVRWGILGAAKFAREHMGPAIHAASGAELAALATGSQEKAAAFQAFAPGLKVHADYDALLADPGIDAVYVPLPNHMHVEWTLKAIAAGKAVLCEKPIALKAEEIDAIIEARDKAGVLAAEAFMIVHHPQWQLVRDWIANGRIGELVHVRGAFSFDNSAETGNIRNRAETGGGALRDIGVYVLGSVRFATGQEPDEIGAKIRWDKGIDSFAAIEATFPGFTYSSYVSMRMGLYQEMSFHGTTGTIRVTAPFNAGVFGEARVELHAPGLVVESKRFPSANHYVLQVQNFGRSLREGVPYGCSLEFTRGTQVALDRIYDGAVSL